VRDRVGKPEPGEAEELREAPQQDHGPPLADVALAGDEQLRRGVLAVRLVDDHRAALRKRVEERAPLVLADQRAGRVVRIADPDEPGSGRLYCVGEGGEVDPELAQRHPADPRAAGGRHLGVEPVGRTRHDDLVAAIEERAGHRRDECLHAVGRHDPLGRNSEPGRDRVAEVVVALLRVGPRVLELGCGRLARPRIRLEEALVPVQLRERVEAVDCPQLADACAGAVGLDPDERRAYQATPIGHHPDPSVSEAIAATGDHPRAALAGFLIGAAAMFATMYSTQAILPEVGRDFDVSPSAAGLTISVVVLALALSALVWGPLSDRIGRKRSIVLASALLVAPTVGAGLAPTFGVLLVFRALQGFCMPGLLAVGLPYVTEALVPAIGGQAMGYFVSSLIAGGLIGRIGVALLTAAVGWRWAIGGLAVLPFGAALLMQRALVDLPLPERTAGRLRGARQQLRNRNLLRTALVGSTFFFAFVGVFSYA